MRATGIRCERAWELSRDDFENLLGVPHQSLRRFMNWSQRQARAAGLTPGQHQLLVAISYPNDAGPTIPLAGDLLLRHHSVVELVDRAAAAGLVKRRTDPQDGRFTRVRLTADGQDRLDRLTPAHLGELRTLAPSSTGWSRYGPQKHSVSRDQTGCSARAPQEDARPYAPAAALPR